MALRLTNKQYEALVGKRYDSPIKKNKYRNKRIIINGIRYDSQKEFERHMELLKFEKSGRISHLQFHQKSMNIILQDDPQIRYEPDFCYYENEIYVIEDLKGYQTKEFKLKKKMIIAKLKKKEIKGIFRLTKYSPQGFIVIEEYSSQDSS